MLGMHRYHIKILLLVSASIHILTSDTVQTLLLPALMSISSCVFLLSLLYCVFTLCLETSLNKTDVCLLAVRTMPGQVVWHQTIDICRCLIHQARYVIAHS